MLAVRFSTSRTPTALAGHSFSGMIVTETGVHPKVADRAPKQEKITRRVRENSRPLWPRGNSKMSLLLRAATSGSARQSRWCMQASYSWTLEASANEVAMSRAAFSKRFKLLVGIAPLDYLLRCGLRVTCSDAAQPFRRQPRRSAILRRVQLATHSNASMAAPINAACSTVRIPDGLEHERRADSRPPTSKRQVGGDATAILAKGTKSLLFHTERPEGEAPCRKR